MSGARLARLVAAAVVLVLLSRSPAFADKPRYDAVQELLDEEARTAMGNGEYARALHFFWRLLLIDPNDAMAMREAGRCAKALGDATYAEKALKRSWELRNQMPDPELHYLRGEALLSLGRTDEARQEFSLAEQELENAPLDRGASLWLARIYALRGKLGPAENLYWEWLPPYGDAAEYGEIMTNLAEARILAGDWRGAEALLRRLLKFQPQHVRGREMLAWVLEARGRTDEELTVRASLASEGGVDAGGRALRYGRALERAHDYAGALVRYRQAQALGIHDDLDPDITRVARLMSPELQGGMSAADDPSGSLTGWLWGATLPVGTHLRFALTGTQQAVDAKPFVPAMDLSLTTMTGVAVYDLRGDVLAGATTLYWNNLDGKVDGGGTLALRTRPGRAVQMQVTSEVQMPWRESVSTIVQNGHVDSLQLDVYSAPFTNRLVFGLGGRARRLTLGSMPEPTPHAMQLFGAAGVDLVLWADPKKNAPGQLLDDDMLWPAPFATAGVLSFRHYVLRADDPFGPRLVLVEQSQIDELSGVLRQTFGRHGSVAVELRGGAGYDWDRGVRQWRAGGSLLLSAFSRSRLTLAYDAASESGTGLAGQRHVGWMVLHVDL